MTIPVTLDNFKIVLADGTTYDMATDFSVLVRSFRISSPNPILYTEKIDGRDGLVRLGKDYGERTITAVCSFFAVDSEDFSLLRDNLSTVLFHREPFYIIQNAQPFKRWLVEVSSGYTPDRIGMYGEFTLEFVSVSTYAESVGTTLDPMTFDSELWGVGMGLTGDDVSYSHTTTTFSIFNAGEVTIDPRFLPLKITFFGTSSNLSIKNITTGDEWIYTGTTAEQTVKLDGVKVTKSNVSIFGDTNRKLITLKPGWNDFVITGASGAFTISFDFRFYY
jgi:hypothetical protein